MELLTGSQPITNELTEELPLTPKRDPNVAASGVKRTKALAVFDVIETVVKAHLPRLPSKTFSHAVESFIDAWYGGNTSPHVESPMMTHYVSVSVSVSVSVYSLIFSLVSRLSSLYFPISLSALFFPSSLSHSFLSPLPQPPQLAKKAGRATRSARANDS